MTVHIAAGIVGADCGPFMRDSGTADRSAAADAVRLYSKSQARDKTRPAPLVYSRSKSADHQSQQRGSGAMPGETDLAVLLRTLKPVLHPATYVWLAPRQGARPQIPSNEIIMSFLEPEGETLVVTREHAEAMGLEYTYPSRMITLDVHSSLEAVGFMATISTRLAREGLSVNPVSGYYHDHLFVKADEAERAIRLLEELARDA